MRAFAIALAVLYGGFLTAVAACPMPLHAEPHHCCPAKKASKPVCPMGHCLTDGSTSTAHAKAQPSVSDLPPVRMAGVMYTRVAGKPLPPEEPAWFDDLYLKHRVLRI